MKKNSFTNRTAYITYLVFFILTFVYYAALKIETPDLIPGFTEIWLLGSLLFLTGFVSVKKRPREEKYIFIPKLSVKIRRIILIFIGMCFCIAVINLCFICRGTFSSSDISTAAETEYVIVLGGGIKRTDSSLCETPKIRVKKASEYMNHFPESKAIVTGGIGKFAPGPEAPVMAEELISYGISPERVLQEDKALDTIENFYFSAMLLAKEKNCSVEEILSEPVTVITSWSHLNRSLRLAKRMGFTNVQGIGCSIPLLHIPNTYLREILSYIKLNLRILITGKPSLITE